MTTLVEIRIFIDDHEHGVRSWCTVPRVRDYVEVKIGDDFTTVEVEQVVWKYQASRSFDRGEAVVHLFCKSLK